MKEFDLDYIDKLKELVETKDEAQVKADIKDLHPADIAELINELDDADERAAGVHNSWTTAHSGTDSARRRPINQLGMLG